MQEARVLPRDEAPNAKRKKKASIQAHSFSLPQIKGEDRVPETSNLSVKPQKVSKRILKNEPSPSFPNSDRSNLDSLPDSSRASSEYRALRRKYLLLEDESFALGKELSEVEADVKTLEDEKHALLDELVVLEGLIDPSEIQLHRTS